MFWTVARSGWFFSVGGGIRPLRSFLIAASQTFESLGTSSADIVSNAMLPAQSVALWQPTQYVSTFCHCAACASAGATAPGAAAPASCRLAAAAAVHSPVTTAIVRFELIRIPRGRPPAAATVR